MFIDFPTSINWLAYLSLSTYIYIYIHIQFIFAWLYIPTYLYMTLSVIRFPCACVRLHIVMCTKTYIYIYTRLSFRMVCISLPDWSGALRHHLQSMRCLLSTRFTAGRSVASLSKLRASGIDLGKNRANPGKDGKHFGGQHMLSKPIFQSSLGLSLTISISDSLFNATMSEESKCSGPWMFTWKNVECCGIRAWLG